MLPRPPGFASIKGGELAIISTQTMKLLDERLTLAELVSRLSDKHVAGVAVLGDVSPEDAAIATERTISLFVLPEGTNLLEVEQDVMRLLVERRAELYQRDQEVFTQLTELAIEGKGIPAILKRLSSITGKTVALEDEELALQHYVPAPDTLVDADEGRRLLDATRSELLTRSAALPVGSSEPPTLKIDLPLHGLARLVTPISTKDRLWGFLSMIGAKELLSEADRLAVMRAASACAIEIARDRAVLQAQDRLQSDFVEDLLTGNFPTLDSIISRARRLGHNLTPPYAVLAVAASYATKEQMGKEREERDEQLLACLEREVARIEPGYLSAVKDHTVFLLVPVDSNVSGTQLKKLGEQIRNSLKAQFKDAHIAVGLGRVHPGLDDIKLAYQEARQALGMGARLFGGDRVVFFGELGIYRLLFSLHGTPDLQAFYEETLGPLLQYDRKNGAELVKTLRAYFSSCGSLTDAADKLHLHRNTLLYRLHRVREIAGLDLDDPETRLALQLALRIGETLQATSDNHS